MQKRWVLCLLVSVGWMGLCRAQMANTVFADSDSIFRELIRPGGILLPPSNMALTSLERISPISPYLHPATLQQESNIAGILDRENGLRMQTTLATPNTAVLRINGLPGRYTRLYREGMPLYGGLSLGFDLLQVSALDLSEIEVRKGPAGTAFSGGAPGGAVNLKNISPWNEETQLQVNASSIGGQDLALLSSRKMYENFALSALAAAHFQSPYDPDDDGFSDVPAISRFTFNPQAVFKPKGSYLEFRLGTELIREERRGGDMDLVRGRPELSADFFYDQHRTTRFSTFFSTRYKSDKPYTFVLRNGQSWFDRQSLSRENAWSPARQFGGLQFDSFTELEYEHSLEAHTPRAGLSFQATNFREAPLADPVGRRDQDFRTLSLYGSDRWERRRLSLEGGLRAEYVQAASLVSENGGKLFVLPALTAGWRFSRSLLLQVGGSSGYRMPTIFSQEAELIGFRTVVPVDFAAVRPEMSYGAQASLQWDRQMRNDFNVQLKLTGFATQIDNLVLLQPLGFATAEFLNHDARAFSRGIEASLSLKAKAWSFRAGYTLNDTYLQDSVEVTALTLVPEHSLKCYFSYFGESNWRLHLNGSCMSAQWLNGGEQSRSLLIAGATVERLLYRISLFANVSNILNHRQSRFESLVTGPYDTPQFTQIWAPLTGFYVNGGIRVRLP